MSALHPALILFAAAPAALIAKGNLRRALLLAAPAWALAAVFALDPGARLAAQAASFPLEMMRADSLSVFFGIVFCLITLLGMLYGLHLKNGREAAASLVLAGASLTVVFAGDWITMFVFWEVMSVASLFLIWFAGSDEARKAGFRYLFVHVIGGGIIFAGLLIHLGSGGGTAFTALSKAGETGPAFWLILTGVLVNAAVPPLHAWLTDAYPECSVTGSVIQSAFTTKTAVYVLLRAFPGTEVLVILGTIMAVYGVIYAVMANDIRRLLAYHIVSQVGFMVAGVGLGSPMALDGAAAHAFCHILYKGLLFMGAGAVVHAAGTGKLTELGGLARKMPLTFALFMVGAFSISGLPPFNGFVSKTMTIAAAGDLHRTLVELGLELASVGTFLSIGLKLGYFAFLGPDRKIQPKPLPANMTLAMAGAAALCTLIGMFPGKLYALLPHGTDYHPYAAAHVVSSIQLHLGTAAGFFLLLSVLGVKPMIALDLDWFYRKPWPALFYPVVAGLRGAGGLAKAGGTSLVRGEFLPEPFDADARRAPLGLSLFWISLFFAFLALYSWT